MRVRRSIDRLPQHLKPYVVEQPENLYTAIDHAVWRYVMRLSKDYFKAHAHEKYLEGLIETGIESERIPQIDEMDLCLSQFGWGAVAVSGFIPPAVFMELLSHGVLPIAADIRKLENIEYTPSPDIIHEAAGHAPIVADPEYAQFLHDCGEIARKCIITKKDMDLYEAVLRLSNVKEDPRSTEKIIAAAEENLKQAIKANSTVSEATAFGRMMWWTVEYGLIGPLSSPKIYGAGLLSSIGESYDCLGPKVKKIPFTVDCVNYSYDITEPQPQLFVTPDFPTLSKVAKEFAETLAYKLGGKASLEKAIDAAYATTTELDTGVQISGMLKEFKMNSHGDPAYLHFEGPCQLAYKDEELPGQGVTRHAHGFGAPLGRFVRQEVAQHTPPRVRFVYDSSIIAEGVVVSETNRDGKTLVVTLKECTVTMAHDVLFKPEWGEYDLVCGAHVVSVFGGAADRPKYITGEYDKYKSRKPVPNISGENKNLIPLYEQVRAIRDSKKNNQKEGSGAQCTAVDEQKILQIIDTLEVHFKNDWLLPMECLELCPHGIVAERCKKILSQIINTQPELATVINRGLGLL